MTTEKTPQKLRNTANSVDTEAALAELDRKRALALGMGGPARVAVQHGKGRLTARERLAMCVDPGSFVEFGQLGVSSNPAVKEKAPGDAIVCGLGTIDGRKVAIIVVDSTVYAGSTGHVGVRKMALVSTLAVKKGYPLVVLGDANGGRLPDHLGSGFCSLGGGIEGETLFGVRRQTVRIPRVTASLGNSYGDPVLFASLSDFVVMPENCTLGLAGPQLIEAGIGELTNHDDIGGLETSAKLTGLVTNIVKTEQDCMDQIRRYLSYLPSNATLPPPVAAPRPPKRPPEDVYKIVPAQHNRAYDMHHLLDTVVDEGSFFEMHALWGRCLLTGLARIDGMPVGIMASQPMHQAGVLDANAMIKGEKLIKLCDDFGLPIIFFQDVPGVLIGSAAEHQGVALRATKLFSTLAKATVPRVTVIVRKSFGLGLAVMGGTAMGVDYVCAWATAQIGFMAAGNSAEILYRSRLEKIRATEGEEAAQALIDTLEGDLWSDNAPWTSAEEVGIHDVIKPEETRQAVRNGLFVAIGYLGNKNRNAS